MNLLDNELYNVILQILLYTSSTYITPLGKLLVTNAPEKTIVADLIFQLTSVFVYTLQHANSELHCEQSYSSVTRLYS